ncbi:16S rRNA (guanine(966)-N(2))-methyltransferase RsmD [Buchnera aphidicola]|uniref:Ribosomal RNA small subunit methyltransferase D n=1 Tax=Buchnera aphidicola (Therioaphis trifolii) TaxID=1241884 RepID=A0A4D6YDD1_9GAMM|nr:16S rRNA (guanine(966)-N(2))-methyltransferase RsmD [Buchnera aphidicola]QCI27032.1 16S rRNA (guanine(966)-N(2))-methyltransferase RsmD [Buchnera aphidicola (Therioaphis trifolii)]
MNINIKNIRIISGILKGQIIKTIKNNNLKPTTNRIKETLFNWLTYKIKHAECLDCFSGSGALSIESISRYAKNVTALEKNKKIIYNLKKNILRLKIKNINVINTNTLFWLKKTSYKYDIIFLDPPYDGNILQKTINLIKNYNLIKNEGYIYIETKRNKKIQYPKQWILYKKKKTHNINYRLYIFKKSY